MPQPDAGTPHPGRILGIDPGIAHTGWAVLDPSSGGLVCVATGTIVTRPGVTRQARLAALARALADILRRTLPDCAGIEDVMVGRNRSTVTQTAAAIGVIELMCAQYGVECRSYPPGEVKRALTGNGRAGKHEVCDAVNRLTGAAVRPNREHESDALAVALRHATYCHGGVGQCLIM